MTYRILVVEDEALISLDLVDMLEGAGFQTVGVARDMPTALALAKENTVDLATMDVQLAGGTDGIETALRLKATYEIRSVFVSASLDAKARERAAPAEPAGFFDKPVGSEVLVKFVQAHFARLEAAVPRATR